MDGERAGGDGVRLDLQYADERPAWVHKTWGLTVACGEQRHDVCDGTRIWRTFITGQVRTAGPCTCPCHAVSASTNQ